MRSSRIERSPGSAVLPAGVVWRDCESPRLKRSSRKFPDPRCCASAELVRTKTEIAASAAVRGNDRVRVMADAAATGRFPKSEYHRPRCVEIVTAYVISGASAASEPGTHSSQCCGVWIQGPAPAGRPGMTGWLRTHPEHGDGAAIL